MGHVSSLMQEGQMVLEKGKDKTYGYTVKSTYKKLQRNKWVRKINVS